MQMETSTWMTRWTWPAMWRSCSAGLWPTNGAVSSPEPEPEPAESIQVFSNRSNHTCSLSRYYRSTSQITIYLQFQLPTGGLEENRQVDCLTLPSVSVPLRVSVTGIWQRLMLMFSPAHHSFSGLLCGAGLGQWDFYTKLRHTVCLYVDLHSFVPDHLLADIGRLLHKNSRYTSSFTSLKVSFPSAQIRLIIVTKCWQIVSITGNICQKLFVIEHQPPWPQVVFTDDAKLNFPSFP